MQPTTSQVPRIRQRPSKGARFCMHAKASAPQLLLSEVVSTQVGTAVVPHCVRPPVHVNRQVPRLQMVMAFGSVGHALPHAPLQCEAVTGLSAAAP